jgi:hypothetical protein
MGQRRATAVAMTVSLVAALTMLLGPGTVPTAAAAGYPCEDVNDNGVCDPGEPDITNALTENGFFSTSAGIVVPADARTITSRGDLSLHAGGSIAVHGKLKAVGLTINTDGTLTLGANAVLRGGDYLDLYGGQGVGIGPDALAEANYVTIWSGAAITLAAGTKVIAKDWLDVYAMHGYIAVDPDVQLMSPGGTVTVWGAGDVGLAGATLKAGTLSVTTEGSMIDFRNNTVRMTGDDGLVALTAFGSTVDLRGTQFKNLSPSNLMIVAETVMMD